MNILVYISCLYRWLVQYVYVYWLSCNVQGILYSQQEHSRVCYICNIYSTVGRSIADISDPR